MKITIFEDDTLIGEAEISSLDPPMGVAMATFKPFAAYEIGRHANVVNGDYIGDNGDKLRMEFTSGSSLTSQAISIQDWPELGECEVHILGITEPSYESLFSDHPDYKAYYGQS